MGSFRYSSGLQYITASRGVTSLTNVSINNDRAILAAEDSAVYKATKLETTIARTGIIDNLLAEVMEGYAESRSSDSFTEYRYQERTDKAIYLIEEETVITFAIAPPSGKGKADEKGRNLAKHGDTVDKMKNAMKTVLARAEALDVIFFQLPRCSLTTYQSTRSFA